MDLLCYLILLLSLYVELKSLVYGVSNSYLKKCVHCRSDASAALNLIVFVVVVLTTLTTLTTPSTLATGFCSCIPRCVLKIDLTFVVYPYKCAANLPAQFTLGSVVSAHL